MGKIMTTISIQAELQRIYFKPVTVHWYRIIKSQPTITIQVGLTIEGEQPSQTYIEITK